MDQCSCKCSNCMKCLSRLPPPLLNQTTEDDEINIDLVDGTEKDQLPPHIVGDSRARQQTQEEDTNLLSQSGPVAPALLNPANVMDPPMTGDGDETADGGPTHDKDTHLPSQIGPVAPALLNPANVMDPPIESDWTTGKMVTVDGFPVLGEPSKDACLPLSVTTRDGGGNVDGGNNDNEPAVQSQEQDADLPSQSDSGYSANITVNTQATDPVAPALLNQANNMDRQIDGGNSTPRTEVAAEPRQPSRQSSRNRVAARPGSPRRSRRIAAIPQISYAEPAARPSSSGRRPPHSGSQRVRTSAVASSSSRGQGSGLNCGRLSEPNDSPSFGLGLQSDAEDEQIRTSLQGSPPIPGNPRALPSEGWVLLRRCRLGQDRHVYLVASTEPMAVFERIVPYPGDIF